MKGTSFEIPYGRTTAIAGSSGADKPTTAWLLFHFNDVREGSILITEQDIHAVTQEILRQAIGAVSHDTVLNTIL